MLPAGVVGHHDQIPLEEPAKVRHGPAAFAEVRSVVPVCRRCGFPCRTAVAKPRRRGVTCGICCWQLDVRFGVRGGCEAAAVTTPGGDTVLRCGWHARDVCGGAGRIRRALSVAGGTLLEWRRSMAVRQATNSRA